MISSVMVEDSRLLATMSLIVSKRFCVADVTFGE